MRQTRLSLVAVALLVAGACGGETDVGEVSSAGTSSSPASRAASKTDTPSPESRESTVRDQTKRDEAADDRFPEGYPKVVAVSSLPFELRHSYNVRTSRAVALAPGVWTPLLAGMTTVDAATAGFADGRCGAVRRYEREYLHGRHLNGDCW